MNLTKKNIPKDIPWESSAEESFVRLKEELVKCLLCIHQICPPLSTIHRCFRYCAIGACLAQHNDHMEEMPIAFFSKKPTCPKRSGPRSSVKHLAC
ncbi:hypothetical protein TNCV_4401511 [Trichonephila clavipes]|nr:hypothetical protein TNCV_4401511 [Trichonephila clavipes]